MARRRVTVTVNGRDEAHDAPRPRTAGRPLMPTRTIPSGRDKARRRTPKHRHRADDGA